MNRALLIKFSAVVFIALLILIPLAMIEFKISERAQLRSEAEHSVAASWTGSQFVSGPVIAIDYEEQSLINGTDKNGFQFESQQQNIRKTHLITPVETQIDTEIATETLSRGIYPLTVYTSTIRFNGFFNAEDVTTATRMLKSRDKVTVVYPARIVWQFSDPRGLNAVSPLKLDGKAYRLFPGTLNKSGEKGLHLQLTSEQLSLHRELGFELSVELRGMHSINFLPAGKQTEIKMLADWPHPKFVGAFLPSDRDISEQQFTARWNVNEYAASTNIAACVTSDCMFNYDLSFGVELVDPIDVYLQSERAVKYGFLFVSMIFLGFVVFEVMQQLRIHPVQYALVGGAIALFFLLLISLSEHTEFQIAYGIAATASVAVIGLYLRNILGNWRNASVFIGAISGLYTLLFFIIQSEDYALLMGATLCFLVLATVMMLTSRVDWYEIGRTETIC